MKKTVLYVLCFLLLLSATHVHFNDFNAHKRTPPQLIITEVYFNPHGDPDTEFIEIYNPTGETVNLNGWIVDTGTIQLSFPSGACIGPHQHIAIARGAVDFYNQFGFYPTFEELGQSSEVDDMNGSLDLGTSGKVILRASSGEEVDVIAWGSVDVTGDNWTGDPISLDYLFPQKPGGVSGTEHDVTPDEYALARGYDNEFNYIDTNTWKDWYKAPPYPMHHSNRSLFLPIWRVADANVTVVVGPEAMYSELIHLIRSAKKSIFFEIYVTGHIPITNELVQAMNRGVKVYALMESFASSFNVYTTNTEEAQNHVWLADQIYSNPNGEIRWIEPWFYVSHGKVIIIDNRTIMIATENWRYTGHNTYGRNGNRGAAIVIENEKIVKELFLPVLEFDWYCGRPYNPSEVISGATPPEDSYNGNEYLPQFFPRTYHLRNVNITRIIAPHNAPAAITGLLREATKEIWIEQFRFDYKWAWGNGTTVYPGDYNFAIKDRAEHGVYALVGLDARYNWESDKNADTYDYLNNNGAHAVRLRYDNHGLVKWHIKLTVVDNKTMIGSINWNIHSASENREIAVIVDSWLVANYYRNVVAFDCTQHSYYSPPPTLPWPNIGDINYTRNSTSILFTVTAYGFSRNITKVEVHYRINSSEWNEKELYMVMGNEFNGTYSAWVPVGENDSVEFFIRVFDTNATRDSPVFTATAGNENENNNNEGNEGNEGNIPTAPIQINWGLILVGVLIPVVTLIVVTVILRKKPKRTPRQPSL